MTNLSEEIVACKSMQRPLELNHLGKRTVVHNTKLSGMYDSFEAAAEDAVARFSSGPYLIREVGGVPTTLPASIPYMPLIKYA